MVDDTGIEPVTPSMSTKCSTAELIVRMACARVPQRKGARNPAPVTGRIKGVECRIKGFWQNPKLVYV